jgi:eukaryotic-like serine/threonine-protein kinase
LQDLQNVVSERSMEGPLRYRFGPYEVNASTRELCKNGTKVKLGPQPFLILELLLDRATEVVTRDEIQEKLWAADTFVDFEHGLNNSVKKLRRALCDSADEPRYIETLPRLGYRFVTSVEVVAQKARSTGRIPDSEPHDTEPQVKRMPDAISASISAAVAAPSARLAHLRQVSVFLLSAALLIAVALYYRSYHASSYHASNRLTDKDSVVLADFTNRTGDAAFDDTLKMALNVSLRQSPFLNVLPDSEVSETLQMMTRPVGTKITPEVARELCQRTGGKAYVAGSIDNLGSQYVLGLQAVNCQSGDKLAAEQVTATSKEKVLDALGDAASNLRGELGESLATVQEFDVPLKHATTSSLEALKAYSLGRKSNNEKGAAAGLPYYHSAIELDPNFAMAYVALGNDYFLLNEIGRASEYFTKAFQLREHVSKREELEIAAAYYRVVTGELDKAAQTYQEAFEIYPRASVAYGNLGSVYGAQGQYEKGSEVTRQALRVAPDQVSHYVNLAYFALATQHFDEARQIIHQAQAQKMDEYLLHNALFALAFLGTDSAAMAEQQRWFAGKPEYENFGLALESDTEGYRGHAARSRELTQRAAESALRADNKESAAIWEANTALQQAAYGSARESVQTAEEALKLTPTSQSVESEVALAFAMAGDTTRAESLVRDLARRFPLDTQTQSLWLPAIQTQLALDKKSPATGQSVRQGVSPIELGQIAFVNNISCLYPVYVRGQAYLADGRASDAAVEFQNLLDHSGIVWSCWTGALAHLGVARANSLLARTSQRPDADVARMRALAAYKDFLTLWKDADPDLPILKEAQAEYEKLQ